MCFFTKIVRKCLCMFCSPIHKLLAQCTRILNLRPASFIGGFALGQAYHNCLLKKIPFPYHLGVLLSSIISLLLGITNAVSVQMRCICLLIFPMYCGKAGRGVLKAVALTYLVAGPITNLGMNAKEVVRVFACSTRLVANLSKERHALIAKPFRNTALRLTSEVDRLEDALRYIRHVVAPIEREIEHGEEMQQPNDTDNELIFQKNPKGDRKSFYQQLYQKKLEYRCEQQLIQAVENCLQIFGRTYQACTEGVPEYAAWLICRPLKLQHVCNIMYIVRDSDTCDSRKEIDPGLGDGYLTLQNAEHRLTDFKDVKIQYKVLHDRELLDIQDAKETGSRVIHAFEEKIKIMRTVLLVLNIAVALLSLRIAMAAVMYHDSYLTSIEHDNIYITGYFKRLDARRKQKDKFSLLPLKKMERIKYIDVHSLHYNPPEHSKLVTQMLKLMLEVVTATTFVMLDRLFYEALDVVRQYAESEDLQTTHDVNIEVEGAGMLATLLRSLLTDLNTERSRSQIPHVFTNKQCHPKPRAMPPNFYFKIYGGYLWILLLLYINPYTLRLRRLICSYFYHRREKQRILHLYNDILKKRMKMQKTLRRKAVQAVRAHYLSAENLLSLRMKFPHVLGWLKVLPAARMPCLICGETQPRTETRKVPESCWHSCKAPKCPFVYCTECWRETGARCLACDPSLAELSDIDSLSDEEHPKN